MLISHLLLPVYVVKRLHSFEMFQLQTLFGNSFISRNTVVDFCSAWHIFGCQMSPLSQLPYCHL